MPFLNFPTNHIANAIPTSTSIVNPKVWNVSFVGGKRSPKINKAAPNTSMAIPTCFNASAALATDFTKPILSNKKNTSANPSITPKTIGIALSAYIYTRPLRAIVTPNVRIATPRSFKAFHFFKDFLSTNLPIKLRANNIINSVGIMTTIASSANGYTSPESASHPPNLKMASPTSPKRARA